MLKQTFLESRGVEEARPREEATRLETNARLRVVSSPSEAQADASLESGIAVTEPRPACWRLRALRSGARKLATWLKDRRERKVREIMRRPNFLE